MTKLLQEEDITIIAKTDEIKAKINEFCKKYLSEILSNKFFNAVPQLNELYREHQVKFFYFGNKQIKLAEIENNIIRNEEGRVYKPRYEDDDNSDASNEYSREEEEVYQNNIVPEITEWDFPKMLGRIPDYENGVLEFIKVESQNNFYASLSFMF